MCTGQACLLVTGEDTLDRTVLDVIGSEDGKLDGAADAVVGTQGRALGLEPFTIHVGLDGILVEVEIHIHQFVAHHIHVALQDDGLCVLVSWCGCLADQHISSLVNQSLKVMALAKFLQVLNHVLLVLGRARYLVDFSELLEHQSRF